MNANVVGMAIIILGLALLVGKYIRVKVPFFARLFLPSSIIGGFVLLLLSEEGLGRIFRLFERTETFEYGLFTEELVSVWVSLPGLLISFIFAGLFLGKTIPNIKTIWLTAGPQVAYGQSVAWGQYVVGIGLTMLILTPFFGANPLSGALIEIAFEGGHGTAAGLRQTFIDLDFQEGADLAMGLATVGVVSGVVLGVILINWGVRKGKTNYLKSPSNIDEIDLRGIVDVESRQASGMMTTNPSSIAPLAFHTGFILLSVFLGWVFQQGLIALESATWGADGNNLVMVYLPLFPLAMIGGVFVQLALDKFDKDKLVDRETVNRLQGLALDFLIVSALATLSLSVLGENWVVFTTLALGGILWNVGMFVFLARRMIPKNWFERGIGDFGQSMGMTAAGLMLIRIVDSQGDTKALEAFGYKQLLFEPFVGGGLMTALSVPLMFQFGPLTILIFTFIVMLVWILVGLLYFGRKSADDIR